MRFGTPQEQEPRIDLVPFIDVLLVVLIFLMLTTTYSRFTELHLTLPVASADAAHERPSEIMISITADGRYAVDREALAGKTAEAIADALQAAHAAPDTRLVISADANSTHQAVVTAMEAAQRLGLSRITFTAQNPGG